MTEKTIAEIVRQYAQDRLDQIEIEIKSYEEEYKRMRSELALRHEIIQTLKNERKYQRKRLENLLVDEAYDSLLGDRTQEQRVINDVLNLMGKKEENENTTHTQSRHLDRLLDIDGC
jgi:hypothetical protein